MGILQRRQLLLVPVRAAITRRSKHALAEFKYIVGAKSESQQAFETLPQLGYLKAPGEKLKPPLERCRSGEEPFAYRLDQCRITYMRCFRKETGGQVSFGIDRKQMIEPTYVALD